MLHYKYDYERCVRSQGVDCRRCVPNCVMKILAVKDDRIVMTNIDECVFCLNCQGACVVDEKVIQLWDDERPELTPVPITTPRRDG